MMGCSSYGNVVRIEDELDRLRERLAKTESLVVLTGAGVSAESGVPTFRGDEGLWKTYRAEELATPEAFQRDPKLVWKWYQWRRELIATKAPNAAHDTLVTLEQTIPQFALITQNVDGLHAKAGSRNMIEMHGNVWKMRCTHCGAKKEDYSLSLPPLPLCSECDSLLRPDIVWFGEEIDRKKLDQCLTACQNSKVMFVIGTSGLVQPAASFASLAKEAGAFVVEINPAPFLSGLADVTLTGKAAEVLPKVIFPAPD